MTLQEEFNAIIDRIEQTLDPVLEFGSWPMRRGFENEQNGKETDTYTIYSSIRNACVCILNTEGEHGDRFMALPKCELIALLRYINEIALTE